MRRGRKSVMSRDRCEPTDHEWSAYAVSFPYSETSAIVLKQYCNKCMETVYLREDETCPTCQGVIFNLRANKMIEQRETTNLVCEVCGRDYSK